MKTIQLQGIGQTNAVEAQDLKIGDVTVWNFGSLETIVSIVSETKCFITFEIRCEETGNLHERRLKKTRLVGFEAPAKKEKVKVTYRQVKRALRRGWVSPLNSREGAFELPSYRVVTPTPIKETFTLVAYQLGRWSDVFTNYDKSIVEDIESGEFENVHTRIIATDDNQAAISKAIMELNG